MIHKPFKYEVKPIEGAGSQGGVFAEGERYDVYREYDLVRFRPDLLPRRIFSRDLPYNSTIDPYLATIMAVAWNSATMKPTGATSTLPSQLSVVPGLDRAVGAVRGAGGTIAPDSRPPSRTPNSRPSG